MRCKALTSALVIAIVIAFVGLADGVAAQGSAAGTAFSDYPVTACAYVAARVERQAWRAMRPDTVYHTVSGDVRLAPTIDSVRACVARFDPATVAPRDLLVLGSAYLAANDDRRAEEAFHRFAALALAKAPADAAWDYLQIVYAYAGASPFRLAPAYAYAARLDSLHGAAAERVMAHVALERVAAFQDSVAVMRAQADAAVAASRELTGPARAEWAEQVAAAFLAQADAAARGGDVARAASIVQGALADLGTVRPSATSDLARWAFWYTLYGKAAPTVEASYWYQPTAATPAAPFVRPMANRVSLLLFVSKNCGELCASGYATIRRVAAALDTSRVQVTLVSATSGWDRDEVIPSAADEAERIRQYFHGFLALPLPLAIWSTDFGKRPDGSRLIRPGPNERAFGAGPSASLFGVLIDRHGAVHSVMVVGPGSEARIVHEVGELLR